jgi:large subunit ribosomal protein L15
MLNVIKDNDGARKKYKALGRGIGSGKGKTSARGGKGQTARTGVALNGFEGGQMPLFMRLPKRGFKNYTRVEYTVLNLSDIQDLIDSKKIEAKNINLDTLKEVGAVKGHSSLIKLLGTGTLNSKIEILVHAASKSAQEAVSAAGGTINLVATAKKIKEPSKRNNKKK